MLRLFVKFQKILLLFFLFLGYNKKRISTEMKEKKESKIIYDIIPPAIKKGLFVVEKMEKKVSIWAKALCLFLKTSKYGFAILVLGVALLGGTLIIGFSPKIETTEIYPAEYKGNWQKKENGLERDLSNMADISEFNFDNSTGIAGFEEESSDNDIALPNGETEEEVQIRDTEPTVIDTEPILGDTEPIEEDVESTEEDTEPVEELVEVEPEEPQEGSTQSMEPTEPTEPAEEPNEEFSFFEKTKQIFSVLEAKAEEVVHLGDTEPTVVGIESTNEDTEPISEDVDSIDEDVELTENIESADDFESQEGSTQSMEPTEETNEDDQDEDKDEENSEEKFEDYSGIIIIPDVDGNLFSENKENKENEESQAIFTKELEAIYSDFSVLKSNGELKKIRIGFSFASSGEKNEDDEIIVSWSLNDQNWDTALELVLDKDHSNKNNGGYFYADVFDLSDSGSNAILDWNDVEDIKVRFSYLTNNSEENYVPFFLDALWLETESEKTNEDDEEISEEIDGEEKIEILSHKKDFRINEGLEFEFKYEKEKEKFLISLGEVFGFVDRWDGINLTAEIIDLNGKTFQIPSEEFGSFSEVFVLGDDGEISIKLENDKKFKPGLYKIILKVKEDGKTRVFEQDFTWGVLAINVNKSIYLSGEEAYLQMGALRNDGHTICDANLVLSIKYQVSSNETILSTEDGTILYSGRCSGNNVTDVPDYFAYYTVGEVGVCEMKLTNLDNGYEITDAFEVRDSVPFEVERIGPSRIYPPADYEMILKIKVNEDFVGFIQEKVPTSFKIMNQELRIKNQESGKFEIYDGQFISQDGEDSDVKLLRWHDLDLKQNDELEIRYKFDAPDVSPDLHLLGPLGFYE